MSLSGLFLILISISDFLSMRTSGNRFFFCMLFAALLTFWWLEGDQHWHFWVWTCWSCSRFFGPEWKCILTNIIASSFNIKTGQKFLECNSLFKDFLEIAKTTEPQFVNRERYVMKLSWVDESLFWNENSLFTCFPHFREITGPLKNFWVSNKTFTNEK